MKISVLLTVYNREKFVGQAIESMVNQTLNNDAYEIIIINDGSTDGSQEVIDAYQAKYPNIVAVQQENKGVIAALNRGLELAKADYITRMDDDDISHPERLAKQYDHMLKRNLDLCGCFFQYIDEDNNVTGEVTLPVKHKGCKDSFLLHDGCSIGGAMGLFKKDMALQVGGFNPNFRDTEDYDLWLRMIEVGAKLGNVAEFLYQYRMHNTNNTIVREKEFIVAALASQYAYKFRVRGMKDGQDNGMDINYLIKHMPDELKPEFQKSLVEFSARLQAMKDIS